MKDLPHAPFADLRDDFMNAQTGAEGEGQGWDYKAGATARTGVLLENAAAFRIPWGFLEADLRAEEES